MINRITTEQLKDEFDLIVIGGGINGCGIARDACERGLRVLLLEKEDFGYGASSVSSRLIHGGLRYCEYLEFDLVRESLLERELLLKTANHLLTPLEMCIPIYKGDKRGYWTIKVGMILYDLLSFGKSLPCHKMLSKKDFIRFESGVQDKDLLGAAVYYDAQVAFPERICLENALMAKEFGGLILNHAQVVGMNVGSNKISLIEFVDSLSGRKYTACAKLIVNAAGPWVDSLCSLTNKKIGRKIGGTKGSHIIIKRFAGGPERAIYSTARADGRPFFIIPWQNYYLIGTTDIPFQGNLDHAKADNEEIDYLIDESNRILKSKKLSCADVLFIYTGVRPLPYVENKDPASITRKHIIHDHKGDGIENFISIIGGKLTTYRNLSEQLVDLAYKKLNYTFVSTKTKLVPLIGNIEGDPKSFKKNNIKKAVKKYDLERETISHLIDLYGSRYKDLLELTLTDPNLGKLLSSFALDIRAQIDYALHKEMAFTITDLFLRRTSLGLNEEMGQDAIPQVAKQLQIFLSYSSEEIEKQIHDYKENVVKLRTNRNYLH